MTKILIMGCEGPIGYDPAEKIANNIGVELPEDFHCENNSLGEQEAAVSEYDRINDMTAAQEAELYRQSMGREEERINREEEEIAKRGLDNI